MVRASMRRLSLLLALGAMSCATISPRFDQELATTFAQDDMRKLETSDVLVSIGRGLEPWLEALVKGSAARIVARLEAAEGLDLIPAGEENEHDPARGGTLKPRATPTPNG